jgi:uncharacterized repeat protein (TIGR01451 family)
MVYDVTNAREANMDRFRATPSFLLLFVLFVCATPHVALAQVEPVLTLTKTADAATDAAGAQIGFTIAVSNAQTGSSTALGVAVTDPLPGATGLNWSIASGPANCGIGGAPPAQTLTCTGVTLFVGTTQTVHVVSPTTGFSCGVQTNTASMTATNVVRGSSKTASTIVLCPALSATMVADAPSVAAGSPIGFTITIANSAAAGTASASNLTLTDSLPSSSSLWLMAPPVADCLMIGTPSQPVLSCLFGSLAPGATKEVHLTTIPNGCGYYDNTAFVTASNFRLPLYPHATTTVHCPGAPAFTSPNNVIFAPGVNNSFFVTASGNPPLSLTVVGALPSGVAFDNATGELHGMPTGMAVGGWPLTFTASNGVLTDATQSFALSVGALPCSLDIDGNNSTDPLTDGVMLMRAMFGLTGNAVTQGALGGTPARGDWTLIRDFLNLRCGTNFQ